jgi:hypothetical protein
MIAPRFACAGPKDADRLDKLLADAAAGLERMQRDVRDYACILIKRERIDGKLMPSEKMHVKLRHERRREGQVVVPFAVYLRFFGRPEIEGREVLYIRGGYNNKMIVRKGGRILANLTLTMSPDGPLALRGNRFPITEIGIQNLLSRLVELGQNATLHDESEVTEYPNIEVNGRPCKVVQIKHPYRDDQFRYHIAHIFIDNELQIPIRYACYGWPDTDGGVPPLLEEYTYLDLNLNVGLTQRDFDPQNEDYQFGQVFEESREGAQDADSGGTETLAAGN